MPFRPNAPGVVDLAALQARILNKVGGTGSGAEFALEALRFPYRQVFGPGEEARRFGKLFQPKVGIEQIRAWPDYAVAAPARSKRRESPAETGPEPEDES